MYPIPGACQASRLNQVYACVMIGPSCLLTEAGTSGSLTLPGVIYTLKVGLAILAAGNHLEDD